MYTVPEDKSAGPKNVRLHERNKTAKQSVTNPSKSITFILYLSTTACSGLHRPSSGHHYKNFQNKVKYSAFIIHNMGYYTCYSSYYNVKLHETT